MSVLVFDDAGNIACSMQNPQHFDGVLYRPVKDDVGRYDEATKARLEIVAVLTDTRKCGRSCGPPQDGVNHAVGRIGMIPRDIRL